MLARRRRANAQIFNIDSARLFDHRSPKPADRSTLLLRLPAVMLSGHVAADISLSPNKRRRRNFAARPGCPYDVTGRAADAALDDQMMIATSRAAMMLMTSEIAVMMMMMMTREARARPAR